MPFYGLDDSSWTQAEVYGLVGSDWVAARIHVLDDGSWVLIYDPSSDDGDDGGGGDGDGTYGSTISLSSDESTQSVDDRQGLAVSPNTDLAGVQARISDDVSGYMTAHIHDADSKDEIYGTDIQGVDNGDTVDLLADLASGGDYYVTLSADGDSYTRGRGPASYPETSSDFDITGGVYSNGGSTSTKYRYNYDELTAILSEPDDGMTGSEVIDHFDHDDLEGHYTINDTSGKAYIRDDHGYSSASSYSLEMDGLKSVYSGPWEDLHNYPESGAAFEFYWHPYDMDDTVQYWTYFGGWGLDNCYRIETIHPEHSARLRKVEDGNRDTLDMVYDIPYEEQWYIWTVFWYDSSKSGNPDRDGFEVYLHEADYDSFSDDILEMDSGPTEDTYQDEGIIGWRCSSNGFQQIDDVSKRPL